jgi:TRAP-type uncharacterized transport system fused permease subunit
MTGQFTIPLMKRAGLAPHWAGATEVAASVAGIITPPVMGVAAFIMANILGVPYWEVAVRSFVIAAIYYITLFFSVALRGIRMIGKGKTAEDLILMKPNRFDVIKFTLFFTIIGALIVVLGIYWWDPMTAAYMVVGIFAIPYTIVELLSYPHSTLKDRVKHLAECCKTFVEEYAREVSGLVLLLAGLSMIVGVFTITGWIIKMLDYIVAIGAQNLILTNHCLLHRAYTRNGAFTFRNIRIAILTIICSAMAIRCRSMDSAVLLLHISARRICATSFSSWCCSC